MSRASTLVRLPIGLSGDASGNITSAGTFNNLTVGRGAGSVSTNTAVGASALAANTTGGGNQAFGVSAGAALTTGNNNTALGRLALATATTPDQNTAVGYAALYLTTTGQFNTAVGGGALQNNTTASYYTAVGYQAAYSNTTGTGIAIGGQALYSNTTGADNVSIGNAALYSNTTGSNNTAIGRLALQVNTTASNNTAVGYQAGYTNSTGDQNTFIGRRAGYSATGGFNTFVGTAAGFDVTSGTKNTIIGGYQGNSGGLDIRTANNYAVISDGDGNPLVSTRLGRSVALEGAVPQIGEGITFPATQVASSDANTLDDYEEGTFTPTIGGYSTAGTGTYSTRAGRYTKIGNRCFYQIWIDWTDLAGASGNMVVGGFPFTSSNATYAYNNAATYMDRTVTLSASNVIQGYMLTNDSRFYLAQYPAGGGNSNGITLDSNGALMITGSYEVA